MKSFKKIGERQLEVLETETVEKRKTYSYDRLLNDKAELERKLKDIEDLIKEAKKFKLIR